MKISSSFFRCLAVVALLTSISTQASDKNAKSHSELLVQWNEAVLTVAQAEDRFFNIKRLTHSHYDASRNS